MNTPRFAHAACWLVPLCFGLYSLYLGADSNWDLYNYHLYNPFAWLHHKLQLDLAPAGMQSYFNPLLDLAFFWANTHLPSGLVGFLMGALHGLSFVLIFGIARDTLPSLADHDRLRVPLLLALAGCLTANFLSELGNSMGDDTTALCVLAGLRLITARWDALRTTTWRSSAIVLASGVAVGLGVGLKLTNAVSAIAICLALLVCYQAGAITRLRLSLWFGVGVLVGFAVTGAYWMLHMWQLFGNPLYPQFGSLFPNPLAQPGGVGDARWKPHGLFDTLFWPFIFTLHSTRVGEIVLWQIIWPIVYVLGWLWLASCLWRGVRSDRRAAVLDPSMRFIVVFVALGYVIWMEAFSIYRYLVAIEMLTPLVVWGLLHRLLAPQPARRLATGLVTLACAVVVLGGARTWGHKAWTNPLYHAELPALSDPAHTSVLLGTQPWAWLATLFPPSVAFMVVDSSFPATPSFRARMQDIARERGGPLYAILPGSYNAELDSVKKLQRIADMLGLTRGIKGCNILRWTASHHMIHASVGPSTNASHACELSVRAGDVRDIGAENRAYVQTALPQFDRSGFVLNPASCVAYRAGVGTGVTLYQWCQASLKPGGSGK